MKYLRTLMILAAMALMATAAHAHSPLCDCFDNGDGTVLCEGGFSDGSSAAGVRMVVLDGEGKVLIESKMDDNSEFTFDKPEGDYAVQFDAGDGHTVEINGADIVE